jgi:hypothetical protein
MRIVLIQHGSERVLGNSDVLQPLHFEIPNNAHGREDPDKLAMTAVRRLDESEGRYYWDYRFTPFGPRDRIDGYDVFVCPHEPDDLAKDCFEDFGYVVTECFYAGYIRCLPPAILIDCRDSGSGSLSGDCCLFPVNVWA